MQNYGNGFKARQYETLSNEKIDQDFNGQKPIPDADALARMNEDQDNQFPDRNEDLVAGIEMNGDLPKPYPDSDPLAKMNEDQNDPGGEEGDNSEENPDGSDEDSDEDEDEIDDNDGDDYDDEENEDEKPTLL